MSVLKYYEVVFIVRQDSTSSQVEEITKNLTAVIKSFKGEVTKTEFCGLSPLAYPINKNKKGHYVLLNVACVNEGVAEMERQVKLNESIIRLSVIKVAKLDNNPSALMRPAHHREDVQSFNNSRGGGFGRGGDFQSAPLGRDENLDEVD